MLANYQEEREFIRRLFAAHCHASQKVLTFRGRSGSGKSTLLRTCLREQDLPPATIATIDLRQKFGVADLLTALVEKLQSEQFPTLAATVTAAAKQFQTVEIADNKTFGWNNQITVVLQRETPEERRLQQQSLTRALVDDLRHSPQPIVIAFDHHDADVTEEIQKWLGGEFLPRTTSTEAVRVIVAGQTWPRGHDGVEWGHCCTKRELYGVRDADHWLPVVTALGRTSPPGIDNLHNWLAGICHAFEGDPSKIIKVIEGLPRQSGAVA